MESKTYKVYARMDAMGRILEVNSNAFLLDVDGWTEIDEGDGDKYQHAQGNYLDGGLRDARGVCQYVYEGGVVMQRTQAEMEVDAAALPTYVDPVKERQDVFEGALFELAEMVSMMAMGGTVEPVMATQETVEGGENNVG